MKQILMAPPRLALLCLFVLVLGCDKPAADALKPDERIHKGWDLFRMGEYSLALEQFSAARNAAVPGSSTYGEAIYGMGVTHELGRPNSDPAAARRCYGELVKDDAFPQIAPWALLRLARMEHLYGADAQPDFGAIRAAYQKVLDRFPRHPAAEEAFIQSQATYLATARKEDAAKVLGHLDEFERNHPDTRFKVLLWALRAEAYETLGEPEKQLAAEMALLEAQKQSGPKELFANLAPAYWRIATIAYYRVGDLGTARNFYQRILDEYPNDQRALGAELAIQSIDERRSQPRGNQQDR